MYDFVFPCYLVKEKKNKSILTEKSHTSPRKIHGQEILIFQRIVRKIQIVIKNGSIVHTVS